MTGSKYFQQQRKADAKKKEVRDELGIWWKRIDLGTPLNERETDKLLKLISEVRVMLK